MGATTEPRGLHEQVLNQLGRDLVWGELVDAEHLRLELLEERYGVSRSVVREAVRVLESMRILSSRRRVGIRRRPSRDWNAFDPRLIRWRLDGPERAGQLNSLGDLRLGIEPVAAARAAVHASPEQCGALTGAVIGMSTTGRSGDLESYLRHDVAFHRVLLEASGNEMFASLADVVAEVLAARTHHHLMPPRPEPTAIRLHGDVAEAVSRSDPEQAEQAMRDILHEAREAMGQLLVSQVPEPSA